MIYRKVFLSDINNWECTKVCLALMGALFIFILIESSNVLTYMAITIAVWVVVDLLFTLGRIQINKRGEYYEDYLRRKRNVSGE